ncbi:protein NipSnap homolog 1-like [Convolutriloba macropyga]|uniref:protein NipSnap homolog 1-like n=1 Tax=Convolutriloba macropyga TaxID=536237 RepID=UPI003F51CFEE
MSLIVLSGRNLACSMLCIRSSSLAASQCVRNSHSSSILNPNGDSTSSSLTTTGTQYQSMSRRDMSSEKGKKESWLEKFFTVDTTKTPHSGVVGSPNLYRLVFIKTMPQHNDEFVKLGTEMLGKFSSESRGDCRLIGAWQSVVGHSEEFVHLWQYKDGYLTLDQMGADIYPNDSDFEEWKQKTRPLIKSTHSQIAMEFGYFDEPQERTDKHIYELRSYKLKPGSMIEWANHWAKGIEYRKSDNQNVAGMFTHIGELNMVHHIWAYKSFQDRSRIRKNSWATSGWSETVAKTVPLIKNIKSRVMTSLPYSWLK